MSQVTPARRPLEFDHALGVTEHVTHSIPYDDRGSKADVDKLLPSLRRDPLEAAGFTSDAFTLREAA